MYMVALFDHLRQPLDTLGHCLGRKHLEFDPIRLFGQPVCLHVLDVVRVVVQRSHDSEVFVALQEQSFVVKIREPDRSVETVHATLFAPCDDRVEQGFADLQIIDEIEPSEAHVLRVPFLVGFAVDDTGDASDGFAVTVRHPQLVLANLQRRVFLCIEAVHLVKEQGRAVIRTIGVQIISELNKLLQLSFCAYFTYFYCHLYLFSRKSVQNYKK